jgi:hypothetical protein
MPGQIKRGTITGFEVDARHLLGACAKRTGKRDYVIVNEWADTIIRSMHVAGVPARVALLACDLARYKLAIHLLDH